MRLSSRRIRDFAWVMNSIIGWHSNIGRWARLEGVSVLGDDVSINDEIYVNGGRILPHKCITSNVTEPQII
ncbi:20045_t:CDS:2, partial [Racocetra persica]